MTSVSIIIVLSLLSQADNKTRRTVGDNISWLRELGVTVVSSMKDGKSHIDAIEIFEKDFDEGAVSKLKQALAGVQTPWLSMAYFSPRDDLVDTISKIAHLEELYCFDTVWQERSLRWLSQAKTLKRLTIAFSEIPSIAQLRSRSLAELVLPHNGLSDKGVTGLSSLENLEKLNLAGNKITNAAMNEVAQCKKLKWLDLSNMPIDGSGLETLSKLRHLESINLSGTRLTDDSFEKLCRQTNLKRIHIDRTSVSDAAVDRARRERPQLEIVK